MIDSIIDIPQMLLIGSTGRNSGKTSIAIEFIEKWKKHFSIFGLKVTTIHEKNGKCPRGGEGCGVCATLEGNYEIIEEIDLDKKKDTSMLLKAGADRVFWIKTLKENTADAIEDFMRRVPQDALIICESNTLRKTVKPGFFIMLNSTDTKHVKESAKQVMGEADTVMSYDFENKINKIVDDIEVVKTNYGLGVRKKAFSIER